MRKKMIAMAVTAMILGGTIQAWAASSVGSLKVTTSQWDASKKVLTLNVTSKVTKTALTLYYDGKKYPMKAKGGGKFSLSQKMTCYDSKIEVKSTQGASLSTGVTVKNGSASNQTCPVSTEGSGGSGGSGATRDLVVLATNDLGMHCACPGTEYFMLLPPFNTIRAQVIERGKEPKVLGAEDGIVIEYKMVENTDASLKSDPYYSTWIKNMPKYGFGPAVRADGKVQGISGATLSGQLEPQKEGWWEIVGIPAYPDATNSTAADKIMTDPLGGPNRNPYLTAEIKVKDAVSGQLLTETKAVVPVAFGGCCNCHLQLTKDKGMEPTPANSFALMGSLHKRDSGIDFSKIDPDGDGQPGPIRCSACHLDPAMGETTAPGYKGYATSKYTFSNVLHRWHAENEAVKKYDPNLATNCYACHPGNNVGCFRDFHADKGLWCTDCHGDLNQRAAEGQVDNPWSRMTLPKCADCHGDMGEGGGNVNVFGGEFLNSRGHVDQKVLCSSCHGSPHALYPSSVAKDNYQPLTLQGSESAIGKCDVCHTDMGSKWAMPPHVRADGSTATGGTTTGGTTTGGTTTVDAATELKTTCLNCHGDNQSKVSCSNSKWTGHNGSKVSTAVYNAVTQLKTGGTCTTSGTGGTTTGGTTTGGTTTVDAATELKTTCLNCHGDNQSKVSCSNSKWTGHNGSKVSTAVYNAVTQLKTGGTCTTSGTGGTTTGGTTTGGTTTVDAATELKTTCLKCHSDKQSKVSCSNSKWTAHNGSRVSSAIYSAVSKFLTGGVCR
ncbi:MAG: hypothetical protein PHI06_04700 [Desulfobulbaceae bacterium]|nr:hypothetical protein [Desulfobulbaceae bacterium]